MQIYVSIALNYDNDDNNYGGFAKKCKSIYTPHNIYKLVPQLVYHSSMVNTFLLERDIEKKTERDRQTDRQRERERQRDKDRQTETKRKRNTKRQRETDRQRERERER